MQDKAILGAIIVCTLLYGLPSAAQYGPDLNNIEAWQKNLETRKKFPVPVQFSQSDRLAAINVSKQAVAILDERLVDYKSARFKNVRAVFLQTWNSFERSYFICGEINSHNRMGGYTGWKTFIIDAMEKDKPPEFYPGDSDIGVTEIPAYCTSHEFFRTVFDFDPIYSSILAPK